MSSRHDDNLARLATAREKLDATTNAGRWHWSGNMDTGEPYLATWVPGAGRCQVLSVGQTGAVRNARLTLMEDLMLVYARDRAIYEVAPSATSRKDPKVYRADIIGLRHPDAEIIPLAVNALPLVLDWCESTLATHRGAPESGCDWCGPCETWPCPEYLHAEAVLKAVAGR